VVPGRKQNNYVHLRRVVSTKVEVPQTSLYVWSFFKGFYCCTEPRLKSSSTFSVSIAVIVMFPCDALECIARYCNSTTIVIVCKLSVQVPCITQWFLATTRPSCFSYQLLLQLTIIPFLNILPFQLQLTQSEGTA